MEISGGLVIGFVRCDVVPRQLTGLNPRGGGGGGGVKETV